MVNVGEVYRHYKGNLYQVLNIAEHTETGEQLVIYRPFREDGALNYKIWARPLSMFEGTLEVQRFTRVDEVIESWKTQYTGKMR